MKFRYSYRSSARIACITALALTTTLSFAAWTPTGSSDNNSGELNSAELF